MSEPTAEEVRAAVSEMYQVIEDLHGGSAMDVVVDRIEHALEQVLAAYPTETHDWVVMSVGGRDFRICAYCEREEWLDTGALLAEGNRPCTFERRPPGDPKLVR